MTGKRPLGEEINFFGESWKKLTIKNIREIILKNIKILGSQNQKNLPI